jgi:SAM-dependent methyltransferase
MWPFWAPSRRASVGRALTLAGLQPGERFIDIGCGDGIVLAAAARRGARVRGIELDGYLVDRARRRLARAGLSGEVEQGDIFTADLSADVIFAYLSPAILQEITPRLQRMRGTRFVTLDFPVPDLVAERQTPSLNLYRLPAPRVRRVKTTGWPSAATAIVTAADVQSLSSLEFVHTGGPVDVRFSPALAAVAAGKVGARSAARGAPVSIDLRWEGSPAGTFVAGRVDAEGVGSHRVFVLFTEGSEGYWPLTELGARNLARQARQGPKPSTSRELLAALRHGAT